MPALRRPPCRRSPCRSPSRVRQSRRQRDRRLVHAAHWRCGSPRGMGWSVRRSRNACLRRSSVRSLEPSLIRRSRARIVAMHEKKKKKKKKKKKIWRTAFTNLVSMRLSAVEIVVVNDGSTDRTLERLQEAFRLRRTDIPYRERDRAPPGARHVRGNGPAPAIRDSRRRDRQGERRQGGRAQRRHQRLDGAVLRLARRRLDSR